MLINFLDTYLTYLRKSEQEPPGATFPRHFAYVAACEYFRNTFTPAEQFAIKLCLPDTQLLEIKESQK